MIYFLLESILVLDYVFGVATFPVPLAVIEVWETVLLSLEGVPGIFFGFSSIFFVFLSAVETSVFLIGAVYFFGAVYAFPAAKFTPEGFTTGLVFALVEGFEVFESF